MTIPDYQRKLNRINKLEHIANTGNKHGESGHKGRVPQKGAVARSTYESAKDQGYTTRLEDPEYVTNNWSKNKSFHEIKEHEHPYWKEK